MTEPSPEAETLSIHKAEVRALAHKIVAPLALIVVQTDADRPHRANFAALKQKFAD
ncbi:MAG: hypothetical protein ACK47C_10845 [Paracoccaceae bacterium]